MRATYLYGVMTGASSEAPATVELPAGAATVQVVAVDGLQALVSDYDGPRPADMPRDMLLQLLISHQRVLERTSTGSALLPAKLGTILHSEEEIHELLLRFRRRLHAALDDVGNAVEVDLSATWDPGRVLAEISAMPDLAQAVRALQDQPPHETLAERLSLGKIVQERVDQRREEYRQRVVGELTPLIRDAQPHPRPTDDVVFNLAFLVERDRLVAFDESVDRLGEELSGRLDLRYVGPLPSYSFGTIEVARPDPDEICAAREVLGLAESITTGELQRAYRQRAAEMHPDVNREDPRAEERFAELGAAHRLLLRYVRGVGDDPSDDQDARFDLTEEAVRRGLILEITRAEPGSPIVAGERVSP